MPEKKHDHSEKRGTHKEMKNNGNNFLNEDKYKRCFPSIFIVFKRKFIKYKW